MPVTLPAGTEFAPLIPPPDFEFPVELWVYAEAVARMGRVAAPLAIVRPTWHLRFKIGQTLEALKNGPVQVPPVGEGAGDVRGWMCNFERITPPAPENDTAGLTAVTAEIGVTLWGVHGFRKGANIAASAQYELLRECWRWLWMFKRNPKLGLRGRASELFERFTRPLDFPVIDLHGFSDGSDAFIAQGTFAFEITEQAAEPA